LFEQNELFSDSGVERKHGFESNQNKAGSRDLFSFGCLVTLVHSSGANLVASDFQHVCVDCKVFSLFLISLDIDSCHVTASIREVAILT